MIAVIDYGMGNLRSVQKALCAVGAKVRIVSGPAGLKKCDKLVFPGVGSFGAAMKELRRRGLVDAIKEAISEGKPFLGLCLGMQLLFERSDEAPGVKGLCVLDGEVKKFRYVGLKVPHMGWNTISRSSHSRSVTRGILNGIPDNSFMYFVHSYYVKPEDSAIAVTSTDYGIRFTSGVISGNIYGFQFHPEKSQSLGLRVLKNFTGSKELI